MESGDTISMDNYEVNIFNTGNEENNTTGVTFNNDGTKMYVVGEGTGADTTDDDIHEYVLSTPYDTSTATFSVGIDSAAGTFGVTRQIRFNTAGSRMFISMRSGRSPTHAKIFQYELSTNFSISSATYNGTFFSAENEITKVFLSFDLSHDGKMLYVTDGSLVEHQLKVYINIH